jgi:hypothetical protein
MAFVETRIENSATVNQLGQKILLQMKVMAEERRYYEDGLWEHITKFVNPRRELIKDDQRSDARTQPGQRFGTYSYDGSPNSALGIWRDGMQGFLVSRSLAWFRSEMDNPFLNDNDNVRMFLQDYDLAMYSAFRKSNYYAVLGEWFGDAGSIGTATLFTEEDRRTRTSVHTVIHPREVFIAENKFGQVDTVYRRFLMTARQMQEKFGLNKISSKARDNAKNHPQKKHEIIHAVFPNDELFFGKKTVKGKLFRSVYVESESGDKGEVAHVLRDSGFSINPYSVWRFRKNSDEIYGRSPAADALVEVFGLNQMGKTLLEAAHQAVKPARNVPEEMRGQVRMSPDGNNYYSTPDRVISPIITGINYPIGIDQQERLQRLLDDKYRVNYFQMLTRAGIGKQRRTIEEILSMKSEQAVLMGPQIDQLYDEGLKKNFDKVSEIEDRFGNLPDPDDYNLPDEFYENGRININLTGPLAQAQKRLFRMEPITNTLNELGPAAAVLGPEMLDVINKDVLSEMIVESGDFPQAAVNSRETREAIRQARVQKQAEAQARQFAIEAAKAVPMTKTVEPNSPVEALAGVV